MQVAKLTEENSVWNRVDDYINSPKFAGAIDCLTIDSLKIWLVLKSIRTPFDDLMAKSISDYLDDYKNEAG